MDRLNRLAPRGRALQWCTIRGRARSNGRAAAGWEGAPTRASAHRRCVPPVIGEHHTQRRTWSPSRSFRLRSQNMALAHAATDEPRGRLCTIMASSTCTWGARSRQLGWSPRCISRVARLQPRRLVDLCHVLGGLGTTRWTTTSKDGLRLARSRGVDDAAGLRVPAVLMRDAAVIWPRKLRQKRACVCRAADVQRTRCLLRRPRRATYEVDSVMVTFKPVNMIPTHLAHAALVIDL